MPPFNGGQIQQQLRAFLVFIQLQIIMYFHFLRRPQQPPPAPIQRPRRRPTTCGSGHGYCRERRGGPTTTLWLICMPQTFQDSPTTCPLLHSGRRGFCPEDLAHETLWQKAVNKGGKDCQL